MPAPASINDFLDVVRKSNQIDNDRLLAYLDEQRQNDTLPPDPRKLAALLIREGLITTFQAEQFLQGKYKGFHLGGYRIIERIGAGGTGTVYLGEHEVMRRRVALKVLPAHLANDPATLARFQREAQAAAALDHPNIARAYDFRQEGLLHFLVMEYINGPSLQEVLQRQGALPVEMACEYIRQAALGLQHAHEANLVHRDVKPANLLVDPSGVVKVLDLGLARFAPPGQESVTKKFDENMVMGTADYLAPEQALNLHDVDHRADIYSLGATLYALLAGEPPFHSGTVTQKLLWHQMRDPTPLRQRRPDVPEEVAEVIARMMAKSMDDRYQTCAEVAEALAPFCGVAAPQAVTPNGQPARTEGGGTYVRATTPAAASSKRHKAQPAPVSPPVVPSTALTVEPMSASAGEFEAPAQKRPAPQLRQRPPVEPSGHVAGVMLLGGVMTTILLVVAGVIAFLIWGGPPSVPVVKEEVKQESPPEVHKAPPGWQPAFRPYRLPDHPQGLLWVLHDNPRGVACVAIAADSRHVATAGMDNVVRIWDLEQRRMMLGIRGHTGPVTFVAFARDARRVLSASADGSSRLWALPGGHEFNRFPTPNKRVWAAVFTLDERRVLTCGDDPVIRLWEIGSSKMLRPFAGHKLAVNCVAHRPKGGNHALSAGWDKMLRLWDLDKGTPIRDYPGHPGPLRACAFSPDGNRVLSGCDDGKVRVFDTNNGKPWATFDPHKGSVWSVAVSPDGRRAVSGGADNLVQLWDLNRRLKEKTFPGHTKGVPGLTFTPDGRHFLSGSHDGTMRVWGLPPYKP